MRHRSSEKEFINPSKAFLNRLETPINPSAKGRLDSKFVGEARWLRLYLRYRSSWLELKEGLTVNCGLAGLVDMGDCEWAV